MYIFSLACLLFAFRHIFSTFRSFRGPCFCVRFFGGSNLHFAWFMGYFPLYGWPALLSVKSYSHLRANLCLNIYRRRGNRGPAYCGYYSAYFLLLFVGASRPLARLWLSEQFQALNKTHRPKVFIYGAGRAGRQLARAMSGSQEMRWLASSMIKRLHGHVLNGQPIYNPADLPLLAESLG